MSVVIHSLVVLLVLIAPAIPFLQRSPEELERMRRARLRERPPEAGRTFVFVQPRVDLEATRPPERAEDSDKDRIARAPERARTPTNPLPFARGNSRERVESAEMSRSRGPQTQAPPAPVGPAEVQPRPESATPPLPPSDNGLTPPREMAQQQPRGSGALGEALKNLQRYVQRESFDNRGGGGGQFGPFIQFDTKGVEFGPWVRRFVAQVKRNWYVPDAALAMRGHVVLQFNVHKDGRITDVVVVGPSSIEGFNNSSLNAILASNPTEPLPPEYPSDRAFFTVTFYYNEEPPGR